MKRSFGWQQSGFSLLEISVAMTIYSLGFSGLSLLMILAIQGTANAENRTLAIQQADSVAQLILMNSDSLGHPVFPRSSELDFWNEQLGILLPSGGGVVCQDDSPDDGNLLNAACNDGQNSVVKVFWTEVDGPARLVSPLP